MDRDKHGDKPPLCDVQVGGHSDECHQHVPRLLHWLGLDQELEARAGMPLCIGRLGANRRVGLV